MPESQNKTMVNSPGSSLRPLQRPFARRLQLILRGLGYAGFLLATLLQYQNCAPAAGGGSAALTSSATVNAAVQSEPSTKAGALSGDGSQTVSVIDNPDGALAGGLSLSFDAKELQVAATSEAVTLRGHCPVDQDGAIFKWQAHSLGGILLTQGIASCSAGTFSVQLDLRQNVNCGETYRVSARLGVGTEGDVTLQKACP